MRSDLVRFKALFDDAGLGYEVFESDMDPGCYVLRLTALESAKVVGYDGFVADFTFTPTGAFHSAGIWE